MRGWLQHFAGQARSAYWISGKTLGERERRSRR
jgi:hypothetical protein